MKDHNLTLEQLCSICEEIPDGWSVIVEFQRGMLDIRLVDEDGENVNLTQDDMSFAEMFLDCVNHARASDGLCYKVSIDDEGNIETVDPLD